MNRRLALGIVVMALIAGCGGSGGGGSSTGSNAPSSHSAGDQEYVDPFQTSAGGNKCLTKAQVQHQLDRIRSSDKSSQQKQQAIQKVRRSAC